MEMLFKRCRGQIALPFVLLVGGIIVEIVIAASLVSFFVSASSLGERLSLRALSAAKTGTYDAMARISANKEFTTIPYNVIIDEDTVSVSVSMIRDDTNNVYNYTIEALAVAGNRQRKIIAECVVNQTTGEIDLQSLREVPVQ